MSRRDVLRGLGVALLAPALVACGSEPGSSPRPVTSKRLHTVWTRLPDGPLPPTGGEGLPLAATAVATTVLPTVHGGALVGNLPDAMSAVHVTQQLPSPMRSIGARFGFTPGADTGALCLAAWTGRPPTDTNFHLVITPDHWIVGVAQGGTLTPIYDGPFSPELAQDGNSLTVQGDLDGPTATLHLPDGSVHSTVDARLAASPGWIPGWEFFKLRPGGADVLIYESWAA